jgi:hypothetical protein
MVIFNVEWDVWCRAGFLCDNEFDYEEVCVERELFLARTS